MGKIGLLIIGIIILVLVFFGVWFYLFVKSGCSDNIDKYVGTIRPEIKNTIKDALIEHDKKITVFPSDSVIVLEKGSIGKGFAFSIKNNLENKTTFRYIIGVDTNFNIVEKCKISIKDAENYLILETGNIILANNTIMEQPEMINLNIPDNAPTCTIPYRLEVMYQNNSYTSTNILVIIKPKKNIFTNFKEFLINKFYSTIC